MEPFDCLVGLFAEARDAVAAGAVSRLATGKPVEDCSIVADFRLLMMDLAFPAEAFARRE
jgi:hypothetical protein